MDAHAPRINQMSFYQQQQLLINSRSPRSHYSNRQQQHQHQHQHQHHNHHQHQQQPIEASRINQQQKNISSSGSSGSENDENVQLSTVSTSTTKTDSSQQAMLAHNNKVASQQQLLRHQQQQQQHQKQRQQHQQQHQSNNHRQAALQSHTLAAPDNKSGGYPLKSTGITSADNMTTSSSDHTIDDLHQLAHSYSHHRLTGSRYSGEGSAGASSSSQSGSRFLLGVLFTLAEILLFTTVLLWLYWSYQHDDGLAWQNDRKQQFNTHAALMLLGFIFLNGQAMLIYRSFQCCSKIYTKILHTILFVLATSAISLGLILGYTAQENVGVNNKPIMHFYSLHAWIGLSTVGLFVLQFVFGFVSFLILLCCDNATSKFRAALLPIHKTFGLIIFSLAISTCLTGLLQTARSRLR